MKPTPTPDVINLVVAAREFWDANNDLSVESLALDKALEPFSSLVPYENEPHDDDFSVEPAKALEWRLNEEGWHIADTFFGGYRVERNPYDRWCWGVFFHGEAGIGLNSADNFEAAKDAAQDDFNERINSARSVEAGPNFRDMIIIGDTAYPVHSEVCRAFNELSAALSVPAAAVVGEPGPIGYCSEYDLDKLASQAHHYCLSVSKAQEKEFQFPIYASRISQQDAELERLRRELVEARAAAFIEAAEIAADIAQGSDHLLKAAGQAKDIQGALVHGEGVMTARIIAAALRAKAEETRT